MSELKEIIAVEVPHTAPSKKCPFCPPPEDKDYTTYPGAENDSTKLETIMEKPSSLVSEQSGARDQTGRVDANGFDQEQPRPRARKKNNRKKYTFQAHHLISGNQALKGSPMEDWILASKRNEKATGYSVNCTGNGFWAPSVPKKHVGKWSPNKRALNDKQRQKLAVAVMRDALAQIHIGPHNISDPDDPNGDKHWRYDAYIKDMLIAIDKRMVLWSKACYLCKPKKKKPQATHRVHNVFDNLSTHLKGQVTGGPKKWRIYLSKYARDYHKPFCEHEGEEDI